MSPDEPDLSAELDEAEAIVMGDCPDIWIILVEDRHANVEALPFSSEAAAIGVARDQAEQNALNPESIRWDAELTPGMREDGCVFHVPYSAEGRVRVVRRPLDPALG